LRAKPEWITDLRFTSLTQLNIPMLLPGDADAVRDYLQKHLGALSFQIRILFDSEATRCDHRRNRVLSLNDETKVGDPIII
jgi:hypothetical protein